MEAAIPVQELPAANGAGAHATQDVEVAVVGTVVVQAQCQEEVDQRTVLDLFC